ncbi:DNA polymerase III subunit alpha [Serinicoccus kebangsaanensis]|uniref:DNA polymerase III subunit alpha n=1 Tax=Serinicoccus kebangsaanensis TaxID=2602069 RepID=UPI00124EB6F3|nr:DNA polymerase III subunit alpha [Serinicoccus kebangsaanensis]
MSAAASTPVRREQNFVHLHNHTEYSMLDGAARITDMFEKAAELGMPAIATTDHGFIFGAYEFWKTAQQYDVKPIIGLEAYVTPGTHRTDKTRVKYGDGGRDDVSGGGAYTHMTLLARNNNGMHNLFRMASLASMEGYYFKPRMDRELLETYGQGLIATTGCPSGEIQTRLRLGQWDQAVQYASDMKDIFGADNYFLELMDHGIEIERVVRQDLLRLAKELSLPLLATNDLHYTHQEDAKAHSALLCVQSGSTMQDPNRFQFNGDGYYLKTAAEMRDVWRELPEACDNTLLVADRCDISFTEGEGRYMPRFPVPEGEDETSWFIKEVETGLQRRFPEGVPDYARKQAEYESGVIMEKGYCFTPETPVLMADGSWQRIDEIDEGDEVTSISTWNYRGRRATVEKVLSRQVTEDIHCIQPFGQPWPISATSEHPFLVARKGWVEAQNVAPGDELLLPQPERGDYAPFDLVGLMRSVGWEIAESDGRVMRMGRGERRAARANHGGLPSHIEWSPELMWLLGLWVAEGHVYDPHGDVNPGQIGWTLHKDEPAVARLCSVIEALDLGRPRVYTKASSGSPHHQGVVVMLTNHPLALLLGHLFGAGVRNKHVGSWVRSVPDEGIWAFIDGWREGDGHVDRGRHMVTTVNPTLARELRSLILSLGQWATIQHSPSQRTCKVLWVPNATKNPYNARLVDGRWWVRVRSVDQKPYSGTVYNLTVSGDHTYVADAVAVHNCGYFLVVADFINWAKDNNIKVGPGRGSGAGSMCAYAMGITDLDPIPHGLIFERFLNPERKSMPDFDVDFDDRRRSEVIRYVTEKYGDERVAMIVTYGTIKAKQALKDASRVMGFPFAMGERLTKAMPPPVMGKDISLAGIQDPQDKRYAEAGEFRELLTDDEHAAEVFDTATGLEGLKRQWGVHAAGVIMSSEPLIDVIPIMRRDQDGQIITQFDYPTCESLGLVKMDFLGLRNLTVLDDAIHNIKDNRGQEIDLDALSKDMTDGRTYELLGRGDTLGVFQLDGNGMRQLLRLMQPDNFEDISAALALYRPGPMGVNAHTNFALRKNGKQENTPLDPELKGKLQPEMEAALEPILGTTYGLCIYQEQVMEIAQKLAGYTLGNADLLRRAMGKKKKEVLDAEYIPFSEGMKSNGFTEASVAALWGVLVPFSDYAFNKAHTAAYGVISYWTAYLKANYPAEYMAALLTSVGDDKDKTALYLAECRRLKIPVLPPDVNESIGTFAAVGDDIRFGLQAIRNVGANVVQAIVDTREEKGAFTSFEDFLRKCPAVVCNKRTIESLCKAGAFDSLGHTRQGLVTVHERYVEALADEKKQEAIGQDSLFSGFSFGDEQGEGDAVQIVTLPPIPGIEWDKTARLAFEREMLGLYVSDHPLNGIEHILSQHASASILQLVGEDGAKDGDFVTVAGLITNLQLKRTKNGDPYARASVEDMAGSLDVVFWPKTYMTISTMLAEDTVVVVKGRLKKDESTELMANEMTLPDIKAGPRGPVVLNLPLTRVTDGLAHKLKGVLADHPGATDVHVKLTQPGRTVLLKLDESLRVTATPELFGDLKALLGPSSVGN